MNVGQDCGLLNRCAPSFCKLLIHRFLSFQIHFRVSGCSYFNGRFKRKWSGRRREFGTELRLLPQRLLHVRWFWVLETPP